MNDCPPGSKNIHVTNYNIVHLLQANCRPSPVRCTSQSGAAAMEESLRRVSIYGDGGANGSSGGFYGSRGSGGYVAYASGPTPDMSGSYQQQYAGYGNSHQVGDICKN